MTDDIDPSAFERTPKEIAKELDERKRKRREERKGNGNGLAAEPGTSADPPEEPVTNGAAVAPNSDDSTSDEPLISLTKYRGRRSGVGAAG
jgi:hypothetical protein